MAKDERPKENLLRDATAFPHRLAFKFSQPPASSIELEMAPDILVFVGFRANHGVSLYFGEDPVYHWNSRGELRRAHVDGCLVKAESHQLVSMQRRRDSDEVQLIARPLDAVEQQHFLDRLRALLQEIATAFGNGSINIVGQVDSESQDKLLEWLRNQQECPMTIAESPHAV